MKNKTMYMVSISSINDLDKITKNTKYINIDITNPDYDVIAYFMDNGYSYMYSDMIESVNGYTYVSYEEFFKAEKIIELIYTHMPNNLNKLAKAKYLYVALAKSVFFDINANQKKNDIYDLSLVSTINNLWGSLAKGCVTDISVAKIYYYLCKRMGIDTEIVIDYDKQIAMNKVFIGNQILLTDIYEDIPYIKCGMQTRNFNPYNDDIELDHKIKYIRDKYKDYYLDKVLKDIDYTQDDCIYLMLEKTRSLIDVDKIKPYELGVIYKYLFDTYCPNYDIKINNLYLNDDRNKNHFIMISYSDNHYSYNYTKKSFTKINGEDITDNILNGKIGLYHDEYIPNIDNCLNLTR